MSDRLEIPQVIRDAVHNALASYPVAANTGHAAEIACEAFARALKEHPIVPTDKQVDEVIGAVNRRSDREPNERHGITRLIMDEWPTRMFLEPEPEMPDAVKDLLQVPFSEDSTGIRHVGISVTNYEEKILEAYRRGKESTKEQH